MIRVRRLEEHGAAVAVQPLVVVHTRDVQAEHPTDFNRIPVHRACGRFLTALDAVALTPRTTKPQCNRGSRKGPGEPCRRHGVRTTPFRLQHGVYQLNLECPFEALPGCIHGRCLTVLTRLARLGADSDPFQPMGFPVCGLRGTGVPVLNHRPLSARTRDPRIRRPTSTSTGSCRPTAAAETLLP